MIELADFLQFLTYIPHGIFIAAFLSGLAYAVGWALRRRELYVARHKSIPTGAMEE